LSANIRALLSPMWYTSTCEASSHTTPPELLGASLPVSHSVVQDHHRGVPPWATTASQLVSELTPPRSISQILPKRRKFHVYKGTHCNHIYNLKSPNNCTRIAQHAQNLQQKCRYEQESLEVYARGETQIASATV
jgi:hypothetical protein